MLHRVCLTDVPISEMVSSSLPKWEEARKVNGYNWSFGQKGFF
jgi:hypothetical protein